MATSAPTYPRCDGCRTTSPRAASSRAAAQRLNRSQVRRDRFHEPPAAPPPGVALMPVRDTNGVANAAPSWAEVSATTSLRPESLADGRLALIVRGGRVTQV